MNIKYTHNNNDLNLQHIGEQVYLKGWISNKRNLGKMIFLDLRDFTGNVQLIVKSDHLQYQQILCLKIETVVEVKGLVIERINKNKKSITNDIEVLISELFILSPAKTLPFSINSTSIESLEEIRLKYRYLDLRRNEMKLFLITRHNITQIIRQNLLVNDFLELETPLLSKSTPEGARDYLVPSRLYAGKFYALPQSPQIFKQLYMISGFERYFQIARCFRDEDLRSDRQPEFTQIDIETSFLTKKNIMHLIENIMIDLFQKIWYKNLSSPFLTLTYEKAINTYGTDKPDLRFELPIENITHYLKQEFIQKNIFNSEIRGIKVKKNFSKINLTNKIINKYKSLLKEKYNLNLVTLKKENQVIKGFLSQHINDNSFLKEDEIFFSFNDYSQDQLYINKALGFVRNQLAQDLNLIDYNRESLLWITDFPLFEFDVKTNRYYSTHHPFTAPKDISIFKKNPIKSFAQSYDLVWNGYEIGGGSLRINDYSIQQLMFKTLGFTEVEIEKKFGFFIESLKYGTPPHGGIALGLDRLSMLFNKTNNIRNVIGFPKTQSAKDLMLETPDSVEQEQLKILNLNY
ncbi:Aspartyl-tRNA synthetase [Candidatus Phytoplasma mali]|uniref:Aspartate--tRNA ligase n=1 Tax=Phytoplasma mali (strain AT) TaxID=482235 RepID=B3QZS1_PHYMT|nr:aspartate--tRNA ligase [Candidatus Phytoplasma mali]CAP18458.1 Aspartyl-tRNA synthetase [Candidatus Phytoplasma mali]